MNAFECTFIKQAGAEQSYYFYFTGRKWESFLKAWIEEIYGPVTDFKMELIK